MAVPITSWISPKFQSLNHVAQNARMYHNAVLSRRLPHTRVLSATPSHILIFYPAQTQLKFQLVSSAGEPENFSFSWPKNLSRSMNLGWGVVGDNGFIVGSTHHQGRQVVIAYSKTSQKLVTASGMLYTAYDGQSTVDVIIRHVVSPSEASSEVISLNVQTGQLRSEPQTFTDDSIPRIFNRPAEEILDYVPYDVCTSSDFRRIFFDHYFAKRIARQLWTSPCAPIQKAVDDMVGKQHLATSTYLTLSGSILVGVSELWDNFNSTIKLLAPQVALTSNPSKAWDTMWHQPDTYAFLKPLIGSEELVPALEQFLAASTTNTRLLL